MAEYTLRYDGGSYIGKTPVYEQAMDAAERCAGRSGLSVLVTETDGNDVREIVIHPDGDITHLWNGER